MGEYANYQGHEIKIGTCEDMLYLRPDHARLVQPLDGNVNPIDDAEHIRFRFPWPDEDSEEPGFGPAVDPFRTLPIPGLLTPEGAGHSVESYADSHGNRIVAPCPHDRAKWDILGELSDLTLHRSETPSVALCQQRLWDGMLVAVAECTSCRRCWRYPTLDDARPLVDAIDRMIETGECVDDLRHIGERIIDGYRPDAWARTLTGSLSYLKEVTP